MALRVGHLMQTTLMATHINNRVGGKFHHPFRDGDLGRATHLKKLAKEKTMKLRATIDIEFEADDIMDAKEKIDELQADLQVLENKYGEVTLTVKERRGIRSEKRTT